MGRCALRRASGVSDRPAEACPEILYAHRAEWRSRGRQRRAPAPRMPHLPSLPRPRPFRPDLRLIAQASVDTCVVFNEPAEEPDDVGKPVEVGDYCWFDSPTVFDKAYGVSLRAT